MINELMSAVAVEDVNSLTLPLWAQDKEDGIRCTVTESPRTQSRLVASRTFKPIQNIHIRNTIHKSTLPLGMDGELVVSGGNFQDTASAVMSAGGNPDFRYRVFDYYGCGLAVPYSERFRKLSEIVNCMRYPWLQLMPITVCLTHQAINDTLAVALTNGKEGIILRNPDALYKSGRATLKSQALMKLKPFIDADAQVVGFTELEYKDNPSRRSNTLGALTCRTRDDIVFSIGTGFSEEVRQEIWDNRERYYRKWVTFKYQNHGVKIAPRAPVFLRWKLDHDV
jgi:DNA ligase 1